MSCAEIYEKWAKCVDGADDCDDNFNQPDPPTCVCQVTLRVEKNMDKSTFAYYRLTDYYQNHRRYVKSRDDVQLLAATSEQLANPSTDCSPYDKNNSSPIGSFTFFSCVLRFLAPCGAIANSLFNDTFFLYDAPADGDQLLARIRDPSNDQDAPVPMTGKDIAWQTDKVELTN